MPDPDQTHNLLVLIACVLITGVSGTWVYVVVTRWRARQLRDMGAGYYRASSAHEPPATPEPRWPKPIPMGGHTYRTYRTTIPAPPTATRRRHAHRR